MVRYISTITLCLIITLNLPAQETGCLEGDCENGYGVMKFKNATYYGSFLNGKKHFWGCEVYVNDQVYCGNYSQGLKHLFGTHYFFDGDNDFYMLAHDRNKKLRSGFYIDASAAENGAISMRRDAIKIKSMYNKNKDGTGCIDGNCRNGNGVYITESGNVIEGSFYDGKLNGWACVSELDGLNEHITDFKCGNFANDVDKYVKFDFKTDQDGFAYNSESNSVKNTLNFEMGWFDYYLGFGIHTASIGDSEERFSLQYKFSDSPLGTINKSGASSSSDYKCLYGNCKRSQDGYSIKSTYNDGDWFGYEFSGNYAGGKLNGFACQYSPKQPKLADRSELANSEILICGNFINGLPMYFNTMIYTGSDAITERFYLGLVKNYEWIPHGVYAFKEGYNGWGIETANFNEE